MGIVRISTGVRNDTLSGLSTRLGSGATLKLYDGEMPAAPTDSVVAQTLLATIPLDNPALGTPSDGIAVVNTDGGDDNPPNSGDATWARFAESGGDGEVDVDVGNLMSDATLKMNSVTVTAGIPVNPGTITLTMPATNEPPE